MTHRWRLFFAGALLSASAAVADPPGLTLNFQNADLDAVFHFFTEVSGRTFVRGEAVRGPITLISAGTVTVDEAMEILRAGLEVRGFALVPSGGRIVKVVAAAEAFQNGLDVVDDGPAASAPGAGDRVISQIVPLKFVGAAEVKTHLQPLIGRSGNLIADERMNRLVITDLSSNVRRLRHIIGGLDVRSPQVLIEALIVEVSLTEETKLGLEWSHAGGFTSGGRDFTDETRQGFGVPAFITEGLKYSVIRSDARLSGLLQALATDKNVNILSTPHVLTVNNQPALIRVGEEVPVLTQTRNIQGGETIRSFDFKQVAIELEVTPRINHEREVLLKVHPLVKKILGFNAELNAPVLATREATTSVIVQDGHTVVIGGLMKDDRSSSQSKIPLLGDLPIFGALFRKRGSTIEKTELLVFITPRVIESPNEAKAVTIRKEEESRAKKTPHRKSGRELLREGRRLYRDGRLAESVKALDEAAAISPEPRIRRRAHALAEKARRRLAD